MSEALRDLIAAHDRILVFTGAGISVDSGIPDFRSPGGVWTRIDPLTLSADRIHGDRRDRATFWRALLEVADAVGAPVPNAAHHAVTALQRRGKVRAIVTQNVDGLHQAAGSPADSVIELHGNLEASKCLGCGSRTPLAEVLEQVRAGDALPSCERCGGFLRPDLVVFGDPLPRGELAKAHAAARDCDLCLVLGSSLTVYPAADVPADAHRAGATLGIVTLSPTVLDAQADFRLRAPLGEAFVQAIDALG